MFRPASLFIEPAHFAQYIGISLSYCLYKHKEQHKKADMIISLIFTIALLMSTSGIGLFCIIISWGIYLAAFLKRRKSKKAVIYSMIAIAIAAALIPLLTRQEFAQIAIRRLMSTESNSNSAFYGRSDGYSKFISQSFIRLLFGNGINYIEPGDVYFTSLSMLLMRVGIVGTIIYGASYLQSLYKNKGASIWLIPVIIVIGIAAGVYDFANLAFYLTIGFSRFSGLVDLNEGEQI